MRRVAVAVLALLLAGCAARNEVTFVEPAELPRSLYDRAVQTPLEARTVRSVLYFVRTTERGAPVDPPRLVAVRREQQTDRPAPELVLRQLLAGPTAEEIADRVRNAVPLETELLSVSVSSGIADVNLTAGFEKASAELLHLLRVAQVVWTLTELPQIEAVRFRIHGAPQPVIDQFGVAHATVGRGRYSGLAPRDIAEPELGEGVDPSGE